MAIEQQRVTVRLVGAGNTKSGQVWVYVLRGQPPSRQTYSTALVARRAGERALKVLTADGGLRP